MKRNIVLLSVLAFSAFIIACGGEKPKPVTDSVATSQVVADAGAEKGKEIYSKTCKACHQENGQGLAKTFPPLAKSDFLANRKAVIEQVINGKTGALTVNGVEYNSTMPPQKLNDEEIAAVLTYVYSSWGNSGDAFTAEELKAVRDGLTK